MNKNENGVTLTVLVIIIIVLLIIASISITLGTETIKNAGFESVKTNMLLIQAKVKECVEEANFKKGKETIISNEVLNCLKGSKCNDTDIASLPEEVKNTTGLIYKCTDSEFAQMGLKDVKADKYLIIYNIDNATADIVYKEGVEHDSKTYYTLSSIEESNFK